MAALSDAQLWTVCQSQWGNGTAAVTAFAIALAESGGDPTRTHPGNRDGSTDYGLFQINSVHGALLSHGNWQDPNSNANMAYQLYVAAGNKFTPWVAYNTGAYARFLPRAQAASANGGAPVSGDSASTPADTQSDPAAAGIATATSGSTWLRIGEFLAGSLLVGIFAISIIKNTSVGKAAGHVAKAAAKTAVLA